MKTYLVTTGLLFAAMAAVHVWRAVAEWPRVHADAGFPSANDGARSHSGGARVVGLDSVAKDAGYRIAGSRVSYARASLPAEMTNYQ